MQSNRHALRSYSRRFWVAVFVSVAMSYFMTVTSSLKAQPLANCTPVQCYERALAALQTAQSQLSTIRTELEGQIRNNQAEINNRLASMEQMHRAQIDAVRREAEDLRQRLTDLIVERQYWQSEWQCINPPANNQVLEFNHSLGDIPRDVTVYFSNNSDGGNVWPLTWPWQPQTSGNPVTIEVTSRRVLLHITNSAPLHGVWDASSQQWRTFTSGCFRVFLIRPPRAIQANR